MPNKKDKVGRDVLKVKNLLSGDRKNNCVIRIDKLNKHFLPKIPLLNYLETNIYYTGCINYTKYAGDGLLPNLKKMKCFH